MMGLISAILGGWFCVSPRVGHSKIWHFVSIYLEFTWFNDNFKVSIISGHSRMSHPGALKHDFEMAAEDDRQWWGEFRTGNQSWKQGECPPKAKGTAFLARDSHVFTLDSHWVPRQKLHGVDYHFLIQMVVLWYHIWSLLREMSCRWSYEISDDI